LQILRSYFVIFQGKKSLNSTAIERFINAEKGQKYESKCMVYFETDTKSQSSHSLQKNSLKNRFPKVSRNFLWSFLKPSKTKFLRLFCFSLLSGLQFEIYDFRF
jgi:hypothetical protein